MPKLTTRLLVVLCAVVLAVASAAPPVDLRYSGSAYVAEWLDTFIASYNATHDPQVNLVTNITTGYQGRRDIYADRDIHLAGSEQFYTVAQTFSCIDCAGAPIGADALVVIARPPWAASPLVFSMDALVAIFNDSSTLWNAAPIISENPLATAGVIGRVVYDDNHGLMYEFMNALHTYDSTFPEPSWTPAWDFTPVATVSTQYDAIAYVQDNAASIAVVTKAALVHYAGSMSNIVEGWMVNDAGSRLPANDTTLQSAIDEALNFRTPPTNCKLTSGSQSYPLCFYPQLLWRSDRVELNCTERDVLDDFLSYAFNDTTALNSQETEGWHPNPEEFRTYAADVAAAAMCTQYVAPAIPPPDTNTTNNNTNTTGGGSGGSGSNSTNTTNTTGGGGSGAGGGGGDVGSGSASDSSSNGLVTILIIVGVVVVVVAIIGYWMCKCLRKKDDEENLDDLARARVNQADYDATGSTAVVSAGGGNDDDLEWFEAEDEWVEDIIPGAVASPRHDTSPKQKVDADGTDGTAAAAAAVSAASVDVDLVTSDAATADEGTDSDTGVGPTSVSTGPVESPRSPAGIVTGNGTAMIHPETFSEPGSGEEADHGVTSAGESDVAATDVEQEPAFSPLSVRPTNTAGGGSPVREGKMVFHFSPRVDTLSGVDVNGSTAPAIPAPLPSEAKSSKKRTKSGKQKKKKKKSSKRGNGVRSPSGRLVKTPLGFKVFQSPDSFVLSLKKKKKDSST